MLFPFCALTHYLQLQTLQIMINCMLQDETSQVVTDGANLTCRVLHSARDVASNTTMKTYPMESPQRCSGVALSPQCDTSISKKMSQTMMIGMADCPLPTSSIEQSVQFKGIIDPDSYNGILAKRRICTVAVVNHTPQNQVVCRATHN